LLDKFECFCNYGSGQNNEENADAAKDERCLVLWIKMAHVRLALGHLLPVYSTVPTESPADALPKDDKHKADGQKDRGYEKIVHRYLTSRIGTPGQWCPIWNRNAQPALTAAGRFGDGGVDRAQSGNAPVWR
jgi:hypothetical protein